MSKFDEFLSEFAASEKCNGMDEHHERLLAIKAHINQLEAENQRLINACESARAEMACLVADPSKPDFTEALRAGNLADESCLQNAYSELTTAILAAREAAS